MFFQKKEKINLDTLWLVFEAQKKVLQEKGYPDMFGADVFEKETANAWQRLKNFAQNIEFKPFGNLPLLLVANPKDMHQSITKINGHTELDLQKVKTEPTQYAFEILLNVENGQKMVAKSPKDALKKFEKMSRNPLTINESIALLTYYSDLLKDHYLITAGSFYTTKDNESLPLLWLLDEHQNPELHYAWFHIAHGSYGTGSSATKI